MFVLFFQLPFNFIYYRNSFHFHCQPVIPKVCRNGAFLYIMTQGQINIKLFLAFSFPVVLKVKEDTALLLLAFMCRITWKQVDSQR